MNGRQNYQPTEDVSEQRRKEFEEMVRTIVKLPNGATYTTLKPSPGIERRER